MGVALPFRPSEDALLALLLVSMVFCSTLAIFAEVAFSVNTAFRAPASQADRAATVYEHHEESAHNAEVLECHYELHLVSPIRVERKSCKDSKDEQHFCRDAPHEAGQEHQAAANFNDDGQDCKDRRHR